MIGPSSRSIMRDIWRICTGGCWNLGEKRQASLLSLMGSNAVTQGPAEAQIHRRSTIIGLALVPKRSVHATLGEIIQMV